MCIRDRYGAAPTIFTVLGAIIGSVFGPGGTVAGATAGAAAGVAMGGAADGLIAYFSSGGEPASED